LNGGGEGEVIGGDIEFNGKCILGEL